MLEVAHLGGVPLHKKKKKKELLNVENQNTNITRLKSVVLISVSKGVGESNNYMCFIDCGCTVLSLIFKRRIIKVLHDNKLISKLVGY